MSAEPLIRGSLEDDGRLLRGVLAVSERPASGQDAEDAVMYPTPPEARPPAAAGGEGPEDVQGAVASVAIGQRALPCDVVDEGYPRRGDASAERITCDATSRA